MWKRKSKDHLFLVLYKCREGGEGKGDGEGEREKKGTGKGKWKGDRERQRHREKGGEIDLHTQFILGIYLIQVY